VVGAEKMTSKPTAETGPTSCSAPVTVRRKQRWKAVFAGIFARIARNYFQRYGDRSGELARIAAKNHKNGVENPYAQIRKDLGFRVLQHDLGEEPLRGASLKAQRLLADLGWRRRPSCWWPGMRQATAPRAIRFRGTAHGKRTFCRSPGAIRWPSRARAGPGRARCGRPACRSPI